MKKQDQVIGGLFRYKFFLFKFIALFSVHLLSGVVASTAVLSVIDFDDTTLETREEHGGVFGTPFRLFRIEPRINTMQSTQVGPAYVDVSPAQLKRLEPYLGSGSQFGAIARRAALDNGQVIVPGAYTLRDPDSFLYFFSAEAGSGEYRLLSDFQRAEERAARGEGDWRGPLWEFMLAHLAHQPVAQSFGFITARGHEPWEFHALFEHWERRGFIRHRPDDRHVININHSRFDVLGVAPGSRSNAQKKALLLEQIARDLALVPLDAAQDTRIAPSGNGRGLYHTLVFADDAQTTLEHVIETLGAVAMRKSTPVKFVIINAGTKTEVRRSGRPRYMVLDGSGGWRRAQPEELFGERSDFINSSECEHALTALERHR